MQELNRLFAMLLLYHMIIVAFDIYAIGQPLELDMDFVLAVYGYDWYA